MSDPNILRGYRQIAAALGIGPDLLKKTIKQYEHTPTPFPIKAFGSGPKPTMFAYRDEVEAWLRTIPAYRPGSPPPAPLDRIERGDKIVTFR